MRVQYDKNVGVTMTFNIQELKFALAVLRAIHKAVGGGEGFIQDVIEDIEADMRPRLTLVNHYHCCARCYCEVDDRSDNAIHFTSDGDDKWIHRSCPELKKERPN